MKGRSGTLITICGALIVLAMVAGYFLLLAPRPDKPVIRPGVAGRGSGADFDPLDGEARGKHKAGVEGDNPLGLDTPGGRDAKSKGKAGAATGDEDGKRGNQDADGDRVIDPDTINEAVPGHLLVRIIDKEDERPLPGTAVYFPIRASNLQTEYGEVKLSSGVAGMAKRTNRYGAVIWSRKELAKLIKDQKDAADKKTSLLATAIGYADLFEPLAIPDLAKGAEVTFKMAPAVRVTGKVREKRGGSVRYATVEILQTTGQGDASKPTNRFTIKADALGEFTVKLADSYLYTFHVAQSGYAEYTSRVFNFRQDSREVSILLEAARGISGVVTADGKPLEGAKVVDRNDGARTVTDADGKFAFDMVKDRIFRNDVTLRVSADGYAPQNKKVLANDHDVKINLERQGTLHGVVVSEKGDPIEGAVVECTYLEGNARYPYAATTSGADGKFAFGEFANGRVQLIASFGDLFSKTSAVTVKPAFDAGPVKLVLTTGATLNGTVSCKGNGIAGVTLAVDGKAAGSTGPDGSFSIAAVKPGKHKVKILNEYPISDEQLRQFPVFTTDGQDYYYLPAEKGVSLKFAESKAVNFDVEGFEAKVDRKITIHVTTHPNEAASGVQVTIKPVLGSPPKGVAKPKTEVLSLDLPDGSADLPFSLLNGVSYEATFVHKRFFTATLKSDALAEVKDGGVIEVVLERAFMIKGFIKDSQGNGIESVGVSKDKNNVWNMSAQTDIYGYFELGQLKAGEYLITVFKTSYYQEQRTVKIEDHDPDDLNITLVGANEIRIIVANGGTPQPGAQIDIYRNDAEGDNPDDYKRHFDIGTTDANGEKYINFHWVRNYQIVAHYGNKVAFVNFDNLKEVPEREFTIELEPAYDLKGSVVDKDTRQPLANVCVRAFIAPTGVDGRDGNFFQINTDNAGNFKFKVAAGDYYFYVPKTADHQSFTTQGSNVAAGATDVLLEVPIRDDIDGNYAQILSISAPANMTAGQEYTVEVTVKNMGSTTWTSAGNKPWRLGSQSAQDNKTWGMSRVSIPQGQEVRPKETYVFQFTVTAPAKAGQYAMQWQMVQDGVQWFGQKSEKLTITVQAAEGG